MPVSEVVLHNGDARCIYCVREIKDAAREFKMSEDDFRLDALPIAVFEVGAKGYQGEPVCPSHVADALLENLA